MKCKGFTSKGKPCMKYAISEKEFCANHLPKNLIASPAGEVDSQTVINDPQTIPGEEEKIDDIPQIGLESKSIIPPINTNFEIDGITPTTNTNFEIDGITPTTNTNFEIDGITPTTEMVSLILQTYHQLKYEHKSVYLKGMGGTGKTIFIRMFCKYVREVLGDYRIALTASTGKASVAIGGQTIHSFARIGYAKYLDFYRYKLYSGSDPNDIKKYNFWKGIDILIIDEISMLGANVFRTINYVTRQHLDSTKPFGGLSLILSGDFLQLMPVHEDLDNYKTSGTFIFDSAEWAWLNPQKILFEVPYRFKDDLPYYELLCRVRVGKPTDKDIALLNTRRLPNKERWCDKKDWEKGIRPVVIFTKNKNADDDNIKQLAKVDGKEQFFPSKDRILDLKLKELRIDTFTDEEQKEIRKIMDDMPVDGNLTIKTGAQVMLRKNLDVRIGACNGATGIVKNIKYDDHYKEKVRSIIVDFAKAGIIELEQEEFSMEYRNKAIISRIQFPIILSYAISCYKSQGDSLEKVIVDVMGYPNEVFVALSRVRTIQGLYLDMCMTKSKIEVDNRALRFETGL